MTSPFYLAGIFFYIKVTKETSAHPTLFPAKTDKLAFAFLTAATLYTLLALTHPLP